MTKDQEIKKWKGKAHLNRGIMIGAMLGIILVLFTMILPSIHNTKEDMFNEGITYGRDEIMSKAYYVCTNETVDYDIEYERDFRLDYNKIDASCKEFCDNKFIGTEGDYYNLIDFKQQYDYCVEDCAKDIQIQFREAKDWDEKQNDDNWFEVQSTFANDADMIISDVTKKNISQHYCEESVLVLPAHMFSYAEEEIPNGYWMSRFVNDKGFLMYEKFRGYIE